jgi:hypothetical protein
MNIALIYHTPDGWMLQHKGPWGAEIEELFGTDTLPLPYTSSASSTFVAEQFATTQAALDADQVEIVGSRS